MRKKTPQQKLADKALSRQKNTKKAGGFLHSFLAVPFFFVASCIGWFFEFLWKCLPFRTKNKEKEANKKRNAEKTKNLSQIKRWVVLGSIVFGTLVFVLFLKLWLFYSGPAGNGKEPFDFIIKKGMNFQQIVNRLEPHLNSPALFSLHGKLYGLSGKIHAGTFFFDPQDNIKKWYKQLTQGDTKQYKVSLIPGLNLKQLEARLCHPSTRLSCGNAIDWKKLQQELGSKQILEGQFLADTFLYDKGFSVYKLLAYSHKELWHYLNKAWETRSVKIRKVDTPYKALILASMVEKEAGTAAERSLIAGVFANRLRRGMLLQSDPTVIYAMGELYEKEPRIRYRHLRMESPYNTYKIRGLPPTPIAVVGKEAIDAVLHPQKTKALYFVAKGNGEHYFSKTLKEHNRAVRKYILKK